MYKIMGKISLDGGFQNFQKPNSLEVGCHNILTPSCTTVTTFFSFAVHVDEWSKEAAPRVNREDLDPLNKGQRIQSSFEPISALLSVRSTMPLHWMPGVRKCTCGKPALYMIRIISAEFLRVGCDTRCTYGPILVYKGSHTVVEPFDSDMTDYTVQKRTEVNKGTCTLPRACDSKEFHRKIENFSHSGQQMILIYDSTTFTMHDIT
jgi:hypothetical protein